MELRVLNWDIHASWLGKTMIKGRVKIVFYQKLRCIIRKLRRFCIIKKARKEARASLEPYDRHSLKYGLNYSLNYSLKCRRQFCFSLSLREPAVAAQRRADFNSFASRNRAIIAITRIPRLAIITVFLLTSLACQTDNEAEYLRLGWSDLIPQTDAAALQKLPQAIVDMEDGSSSDVFSGKMGAADLGDLNDSDYAKALRSRNVISALSNTKIEIPGYIVPLEFSDEQKVTAFFIVPYFGACLHLPAPPPNQIIYAEFDSEISLENLYDPFLVAGLLKISLTDNELGTSAYTLDVARIKPLEE